LLVALLPVLVILAWAFDMKLFPPPLSKPDRSGGEGGGGSGAELLVVPGIVYLTILRASLVSLWRLWRSSWDPVPRRSRSFAIGQTVLILAVGIALHIIPPIVGSRAHRALNAARLASATRTAEEIVAAGRTRMDSAWKDRMENEGGPLVAEFAQCLDDPDPLTRRVAARALVLAPPGHVWPLPEESPILQMADHLSDPDPQVRADLVRAIGKHVDWFIDASHVAARDGGPVIESRMRAEQVAGAHTPFQAIRDSQPSVRAAGFEVLVTEYQNSGGHRDWPPRYLLKPEHYDAVAEQAKGGPHQVLALQALGAMGSNAAAASGMLRELVRSAEDPRTRVNALAALIAVDPGATSEGVELLGPSAPEHAESVRDLISPKTSPEIALAAAMALLQLRPEMTEGPQLLAETFNRQTSWQQQQESAVYAALSVLGDKAAPYVPFLLERFEAAGPNLRWQIADSLGKIGPAARPAIPQLKAALAEDDTATGQQTYREAISRIEPSAGGS
jgi:hypothetical protein